MSINDKQLSSSLEDYLEAIYTLCEQKQVAHANQIALMLNVGKSSVSWALNQLKQKGLINYAPYEAITLTSEGLGIAKPLVESHRQIQEFLSEVLGLPEDEADANACRMEHIIGQEVLSRMGGFIEFINSRPETKEDIKEGFASFLTNNGTEKANKTGNIDEFGNEALPKFTKYRDMLLVSRLAGLFDAAGLEFNEVQQAAVDAFMITEKHQTPETLQKQLQKQGIKADLNIIIETLNMLCELKIARMINFKGVKVYEHLHPESHHDHLFCVKCGCIVEFYDPEIEKLQVENAKKADFRLIMHSLNLYGVCKECLAQEKHIRNLTDCLAGEKVKIVRITAEDNIKVRLAEMGLGIDNVINVLGSTGQKDSNIIVAVDHSRLSLDAQTARAIRVMAAEDDCQKGKKRQRHRHKADRWPFGGRFKGNIE